MPSHPLSPAQALWQHYNITPQPDADAPAARSNPVYHKELYTRLQAMGRTSVKAKPMSHLATLSAAVSGSNWQTAQRDETDEGLGLSEL